MKIFTRSQIHDLDQYTITHEPIESVDLMERAAKAVVTEFFRRWDSHTPVVVFAGPGNNGGDALAMARLLSEAGCNVTVYLFNISQRLSPECAANKERLLQLKKAVDLVEVTQEFDPPLLSSGTVVVDGLFGSGLNKPLAGGFAALVKYINASSAPVLSIDVPSGLMTEDNTYNVRANIIRATLTVTFQQPKLSFLFAENQHFVGQLVVVDIGLSQEGIDSLPCSYELVQRQDVIGRMLHRHAFVHKGDMGHALLMAGSRGMAGAAILATRACLRSGVGKVTVRTLQSNVLPLQIAVPEAVLSVDNADYYSEPVDTDDYNAVGVGPGLGMAEGTAVTLIAQLRRTQCPVVADADALNILANHRAWLQQLPKEIILTPHPKEFDRMVGHSTDSYERLCKARDLARKLQAYVLLKGHYSALCMPDGQVVFNSTGNGGMATPGSGDVLTGIITALLTRGYRRPDACIVGMYLHGLAGDLAARELGVESLVASDLITYLPQAFRQLQLS